MMPFLQEAQHYNRERRIYTSVFQMRFLHHILYFSNASRNTHQYLAEIGMPSLSSALLELPLYTFPFLK
jgi:hypothetical protein